MPGWCRYAACRNTCAGWRGACLLALPAFWAWWRREGWGWRRWQARHRAAGLAVGLAASFVLDVMGGAGALWGAAEVAGRAGHSLRAGWADEHFGQPSQVWPARPARSPPRGAD